MFEKAFKFNKATYIGSMCFIVWDIVLMEDLGSYKRDHKFKSATIDLQSGEVTFRNDMDVIRAYYKPNKPTYSYGS